MKRSKIDPVPPPQLHPDETPAQPISPTELLRLYGNKDTLLNRKEFDDNRNPKTYEYIDKIVNYVLDNTIKVLHNTQQATYYINPFMIATSYIHRMFLQQEHDRNLIYTNNSIGSITVTSNAIELLAQLKQDKLVESFLVEPKVNKHIEPEDKNLSGSIFIADAEDSYFSKLAKISGARCIGTDVTTRHLEDHELCKNSTYFVANKLVTFSIGESLDVSLKTCAQHHDLYTVSYLHEIFQFPSLTLTARSYDDLRSVAAAMCKDTFTRLVSHLETVKDTLVVVLLGWTSDYESELRLYKLGRKVQDAGYIVNFYCRHTFFLDVHASLMMRNETTYREKVEKEKREGIDKFRFDEFPTDWNFSLHFINYVSFKTGTFTRLVTSEMTLPIPALPKRSIQITSSIGLPQQNIFDFSRKIAVEFLPLMR